MPESLVTYSCHKYVRIFRPLSEKTASDSGLSAFVGKAPGYPPLNLFQFLELDLGYRVVDCRLVYVRIDFRGADVGMSQDLLDGRKRRVMIKQKGGCRMASCMKGNVFPATEKLPVNTFYNPVAHSIGRHVKEFPPCSMEQPHNVEGLSGKHLLDGDQNLLGGFLHGKEKPAFVPDPFDIRIFHRANVRIAQSRQAREQKAGKDFPFPFLHRVKVVLQELIEYDQFLGRQAFLERFLRFHSAKAEQFIYGLFDISFQTSLSECLFQVLHMLDNRVGFHSHGAKKVLVTTYECLVYIAESRFRSISAQCVQRPEIVLAGGILDTGIPAYVREKVGEGDIMLVRPTFRKHRPDLVIVSAQIFFFPGKFFVPFTQVGYREVELASSQEYIYVSFDITLPKLEKMAFYTITQLGTQNI